MGIKDIFRFLESILTGVRISCQKVQYRETANAKLSSPTFVDPAETSAAETERLKGEPLEDSNTLGH